MSDLARCIELSLKFDQNIAFGEFGHFARVLADVDLTAHLPETLLINRTSGSITIGVIDENILEFCNACYCVGYATTCCHQLEVNKSLEMSYKDVVSKIGEKHVKKVMLQLLN